MKNSNEIILSYCDMCNKKDVCKYKEEFFNLAKEIGDMMKKYDIDFFKTETKCNSFLKDTGTVR